MIKNFLTYIKENIEIPNRFVVFIQNERDWNDVLINLEDIGFKWIDGTNPTLAPYHDAIEDEGEKMVIWIEDGKLTYSSLNYYKNNFNAPQSIDIEYIRNKKFKKIENPDLDPYGEEDWGYEEIKENNSYETHINICDLNNKYRTNLSTYEDKLKELLLNKFVKFITYPTLNLTRPDDYIWIADIITDLKCNRDNSIIVTVSNGKKYYLLYLEDGLIVMDKDLYEKEKKRKEELRLRMMEIDPYGEEDWENESKVNESILTLDDFKVGDRIIYTWKGSHEDDSYGLKNVLYGLTGKVIRYYENKWLGIQFDKELGFLHNCHRQGKNGRCYYVIPSAVEHLDPIKHKEMKRKQEESRLKHMDIDPYGEEDWSWD